MDEDSQPPPDELPQKANTTGAGDESKESNSSQGKTFTMDDDQVSLPLPQQLPQWVNLTYVEDESNESKSSQGKTFTMDDDKVSLPLPQQLPQRANSPHETYVWDESNESKSSKGKTFTMDEDSSSWAEQLPQNSNSIHATSVGNALQESRSTQGKTISMSKQLFDITESFTMPNDLEISEILHPSTESGDKLPGWNQDSPGACGDMLHQIGGTFLSTINSGHLDTTHCEPVLRPKTSSPVIPEKKLKTEPYFENIFQAGTYKVHIELEQLWLKSKEPLTPAFSLALSYPPLGIEKCSPVISTAKKDPLIPYISGDPSRKCALIYGGNWDLVEKIEELSNDLLHQPILVEVRLERSKDLRSAPIAVVEIPFGEIFGAPVINYKRTLKNSAALRRVEDSQRLGCLNYSIELNEVYTLNESQIRQDKDKDAMDGLAKFKDNRKSTVAMEDKANDWIQWKINEMNRFREELKGKEFQHMRCIQQNWEERNAKLDSKHNKLIHDYKCKTELLLEQYQELDERHNLLLEREDELHLIFDQSQHECPELIHDLESRFLNLKQDFESQVIDLKNDIANLEIERQILKNKYFALQSKLRSVEYNLENLKAEPNRSNYSDLNKLEVLEHKIEQVMKHFEFEEERFSISDEIKRFPLMKHKLASENELSSHSKSKSISLVSRRGHSGQSQFSENDETSRYYDKVISLETDYDDSEFEVEKVTTCIQPGLSIHRFNARPMYTEKNESNLADSSAVKPNLDITRLTADYIESLDLAALSNQIRAITGERNRLAGTKIYSYSDPYVRKLENALTHLASVYELKKEYQE